MLDKFQKLFGPNDTTSDAAEAGSIYTAASHVAAEKPARAASFRRRVFGFLAFVLLLCAVLPWVFEPAEDFAKRGAVTEIPKQASVPYSQRMPVTSTKNAAKKNDAPKADVVARNLSQANPAPAATKSKATTSEKKGEAAATGKVNATTQKIKEEKGTGKKATASRTKVTTTATATAVNEKVTQKASSTATSSTLYYIQLLATSNKTSANEHANRIRKLGLPVYVEKTKRHQSDIWRVRVGKFDSLAKAKTALDRLALNSVTNGGIMTEKPTKK